ncbi:MAG: peptidoglycan DD-metalloendopeptidase family protein [Thiohalophilus sp.]|uniref:murein hydrolase activator EnvC family protein n=1 Tax=Thiohalophilus sp. TaxID=3028392 RepID=UPI00286FFE72|nr:peptidoglycan DD-metalloendopeptidase family protein [Thiohalophilus sp.]MDR9437313.1 peptidoglycan DD-metalloendopeptidase family protein [Thiohalophilus sp.]
MLAALSRWILLLTLMFPLASAPVVYADSATQQQKARELETLRAKIDQLKQELASRRELHSDVVRQLQQIETRIGRQVKSLRNIKDQLKAQNRKLTRLQQEQRQLQGELAGQRELLGQQIKAAYIIGRQEFLKLLLNQQNPAALGRVSTYYDYFNRARSEQIDQAIQTITRLDRVESEIEAQRGELQTLLARETRQKEELEKNFRQRSQALVQLKREINSKDQQLSRLREDEKQLQQLLQGLNRELGDLLTGKDSQKRFAELRGRLTWPARGNVQKLFGQSRNAGKLRWNGVLIGESAGNTVYAVAPGRVAYADWLRGYGLLMIIDHGDGYMSLYGHNQGLLKEVGDWVEAEEPIAEVGSSGGRDEAGLYFEIRHNGKPTNPASWCRRTRRG